MGAISLGLFSVLAKTVVLLSPIVTALFLVSFVGSKVVFFITGTSIFFAVGVTIEAFFGIIGAVTFLIIG